MHSFRLLLNRTFLISATVFLLLSSVAFAQVKCKGWAGPGDESTGTPFDLDTDVDNDFQTSVVGTGDEVHALMLYFKEENRVEISVTDLKTGITAGSHGSFNGEGLINTGYTFAPGGGKAPRHVGFECRR